MGFGCARKLLTLKIFHTRKSDIPHGPRLGVRFFPRMAL